MISIRAAAAGAALRSLGPAGKSAHFFRVEPDGPGYPASGRELARQEQDARARETQVPELEGRAEPEQHEQPRKPLTALFAGHIFE